MPLSKVWAGSLVLLAAVSLPLHAASPVKVGSKIDTEGALLGNIILQVLESHGVPTVNKVQLGTTPVVRGAITSGELDIYPEYTGNGAFFFKDENDAAWKNAQQGYEKVKKLDAEQNKLIWLTPAPANNTWTIAVRQDVFDDALAQHLTLLFGAVLPALVIGVPLGIWCYFSTARQGAIFSLLNVIQTVPSVALFGLLIAPLAGLVTAFPWLGKLGIAGTGMTPALIALVLYALLPLVRGVVVGLNQIPRDVLESARAMGMSGAQRFLHVQLPLALPVFLRSLRVVMVQTVGMAVIAALIGAGGFGALVFQGLLSSAIDLVLLGVIPVIVLAVLIDALFDLLIALLKVKRND